eukprot:982304-Prymnesium_polylepis.1
MPHRDKPARIPWPAICCACAVLACGAGKGHRRNTQPNQGARGPHIPHPRMRSGHPGHSALRN